MPLPVVFGTKGFLYTSVFLSSFAVKLIRAFVDLLHARIESYNGNALYGQCPSGQAQGIRKQHTVQKVHWNVLSGILRPIFSSPCFGATLLRLRRPLCWRDPKELKEPRELWENLEANDPDDGDVPKLLADDPLQDLSASSSVKFKL